MESERFMQEGEYRMEQKQKNIAHYYTFNTESIFMSGVKLGPYTGRRKIVSGVAGVLASGLPIRRLFVT